MISGVVARVVAPFVICSSLSRLANFSHRFFFFFFLLSFVTSDPQNSEMVSNYTDHG